MSKIATKSRSGYRSQISAEFNRVNGMVDGSVPQDMAVMKRACTKIKGYLEQITVLNGTILEAITVDGDLDNEIQSQQQYDEHVVENLLIIEEAIEQAQNRPVIQRGESMRSSGELSTRVAQVKLPRLEIPPFHGDYLEWQGFWDIYKVTVHDDVSLSKVQKFSYLLSCLHGEALDMVRGFQLSDANYDEVVSVLIERYGDKQRAQFGHFEALVAIKPASLDSRDLVRVYYECERHIRSLVALGMSESDFTVAFVPIILQKLPAPVKREVWATNGGDDWTMSNLRKYLKAAITARERSDSTSATGTGSSDYKKEQKKASPKLNEPLGSASMLVAPQKTRKCTYCQNTSHYSEDCDQFKDSVSRTAFLVANGRCPRCLGSGHVARDCRAPARECFHCHNKGHHRSLCYSKFGRPPGAPAKKNFRKPKQKENTGSALLSQDALMAAPTDCSSVAASAVVAPAQKQIEPESEVSMLPTAVTTFLNDSQTQEASGRLLMDTASSRSHVTEDLCKKLNLKVVEESYVSAGRFGSKKRITSKTARVHLNVKCSDGTVVPIVASVAKVISTPICRYPIDPERFPVVKRLPLGEPLCKRPDELPLDVLIGSDYYYQFVNQEAVIQCEGGPVLVSSKFGFLTAGTMLIENVDKAEDTLVLLLTESSPGRCDDPYDRFGIERFWKLEDVGTKAKANASDISDEQALTSFYETLKFENGRYSVKWPWKSEKPDLADNKRLAFARLRSTYGRLTKDRKLLEAYNDIIQKKLDLGVVEVAPVKPTGTVYYIPHHEVYKPQSITTPIRVVFDASSKMRKDDLSLNDCLHRGLVILDDLCGLLLRFRMHKIAIVADIEKAFWQISLQETERDVARFFWVKSIDKPLTPDNIVILRFARVFFGAISSPSLLGATLDAHAMKTEAETTDPDIKEMVRQFRSNRYSDNVICGAETVAKAVRHCQEAKKMCQVASMNLRETYTNSDELRQALPEGDRGLAETPMVLGVTWKLKPDTLSCRGLKKPILDVHSVPTKRQIVREVAQVFDPCGWFSPVVISGKMLIQELWKAGVSWDEPVNAEIARKWEKVRIELNKIADVEIPRLVGQSQGTYQLHAICDASQKAAAAAVYWRTESADGMTCDLVFAKTRLAPVEPTQTIPRLELVAIELGVNLLAFVEREMRIEIEKRVVWSDSQCALHWLRKDRLTTQFVKNRVSAILSHDNVHFRYIGTAENPADLPSRGCETDVLATHETWWHGPQWLRKDESNWPKDPLQDSTAFSPELVVARPETPEITQEAPIIPIEKFSSLKKLLRTTVNVLRASRNFRFPPNQEEVGEPTLAELASAKEYWEKHTQKCGFPRAFKVPLKKWAKESKLRQLNVFKDSAGLLRCRGRLGQSELLRNAKEPILLPKNEPFTKLVIRSAHEEVCHAGVSQTLTQVRQDYWVIHGRSQVKKVVRECTKCRRVEGGPYAAPRAPDLPEIRVTQKSPFAYTGFDYLGPLLVKSEIASTERHKVWVCLFTCALTRAVHLEVVENQAANEFHLALRRFFALYGTPLVLVSDNASQFRTVEDAMARLFKSLQKFAVDCNIEWRKIPEMAPWMGGFYERMVGTVKRFLKKALDGICVHSSELRTIVAEIAYIVNSRPLMYVEDDISSYSLSPRDFLGRATRSSIPTYDETYKIVPKSTVNNLVENWKRVQSITTKFWEMWKKGYLTSLREKFSNSAQRNPSSLFPTIDSVVQVKDKLPRGQWKLGRVEKLIPSRDGKIRSVVLRMANGKSITRPISKLFPLEMGSSDGAKPFDPPIVHTETPMASEQESSTQAHEPDEADASSVFEGFSQSDVQAAEGQLDRFLNAFDEIDQPHSSGGGGN